MQLGMDPGRPRFVVVYQDRRLPLPEGELVVGRAIGCHIRFNAAEVSRQHLRLRVQRARLLAENLSSTTGTLLNGKKITGVVALSHGDELVLGPRKMRIEVEDVAQVAPVAMHDDHADEDAEPTRAGSLETEALVDPGGAQIDFHHCPKCKTKVAFGDDRCPTCQYRWSEHHPSSVTGRVTLRGIGNPAAFAATVPVVYGSDELTIDAVVTDLAVDRAFVPAPLLDPNGTRCELTLLPEGIHAMTLAGVVTAVRATANAQGPAGMEVRFTDVPAQVRTWLERWADAHR